MKTLYFSLFLFLAVNCLAAQAPGKKSVVKYETQDERSLMIASQFGQALVINNTDLHFLEEKTICQIELVYTAFSTSANFDQNSLNRRRMDELIKILPQIAREKPLCIWVAQTGAKTAEAAKTYFHGFVIHYADRHTVADFRDWFSDKSVKMKSFQVNNATGGTLEYESGTKIHIPANAVLLPDGKPVKGNFEIQYREFRDPAQIALSGLPMTYSSDGKDHQFSSVGMYEIRGVQNGQELTLSKNAVIDLNCTKATDGVGFYEMNDQTGEWKKLSDIDFKPNAAPTNRNAVDIAPAAFDKIDVNAVVGDRNAVKGFLKKGENHTSTHDAKGLYVEWTTEKTKTAMGMNAAAWKIFMEKTKDSTNMLNAISAYDQSNHTFTISSRFYKPVLELIFGVETAVAAPVKQIENKGNNTLLAENSDANHTYPTLVKGLNSTKFGVYNADQVYQLEAPLVMSPIYIDKQSGKPLTDLRVTCVMDLNFNGSFSFDPRNVTLSAKGKNAVLTFTNDQRVYFLSEADFAKVDTGKSTVRFEMTEVTDQLNSPEELRKLLGI